MARTNIGGTAVLTVVLCANDEDRYDLNAGARMFRGKCFVSIPINE